MMRTKAESAARERRHIKLCRIGAAVLALAALGVIGGIENGTLMIGEGSLILTVIAPALWYGWMRGFVLITGKED